MFSIFYNNVTVYKSSVHLISILLNVLLIILLPVTVAYKKAIYADYPLKSDNKKHTVK